jgi:hypothetical protein
MNETGYAKYGTIEAEQCMDGEGKAKAAYEGLEGSGGMHL